MRVEQCFTCQTIWCKRWSYSRS